MKKSEAYEWIESIVIAIVLAIIIKTFLFDTTKVIGKSMEPTLYENDRLFSNKMVLKVKKPKRGDVVIINSPNSDKEQYIKRVIGLEGDLIEILDGQVYLNGEKLEEDYIEENSYTDTYDKYVWRVPKGHIFLLGDNRKKYASEDSRSFGYISINDVRGVNKYRYYPFDKRIGSINR